ncbi:MAG TPA: serine hydrolase, partial [Xanthomonadales bacterium]|nr:serine hydrolase [Xanthomonadales bacterium]
MKASMFSAIARRASNVLLTGLLVCLSIQAALADQAWPVSTPAAEGVDESPLAALDTEIAAGAHGNIDGLLVIRHGKIIFDTRYEHDYATLNPSPEAPSGPYNYYDPAWHPWYSGNPGLHTMQSVTKSVIAVLFGIAQQKGLLTRVDAPAMALIPHRTIADPDGRKAAITLADLLTMRSGLSWNEDEYDYTDPRNDCAVMEASDDWVGYVLDKPMAVNAGSAYVYNSGVTMVLAEILETLTGKKIAEYAETELFGPLGITDYYWKHTPTGLADAEGGLYLAPADIAKIAKLYLDDGRWNGRQIVPASWVHDSLVPATVSTYPENEVFAQAGYGYQWWVYSDYLGHTAWGGSGYGGQYPVVLPDL